MKILWQGARGSAVRELQKKLRALGLEPGVVDGIFGPLTKKAVVAFQKSRALSADGIVGPQTMSALGLSRPSITSTDDHRTNVFVSYSHVDSKWLKMLQIHLAPLVRTNVVVAWDDTKIAPGQKWRDEISNAIRSAKVAVLLISPYFMASEFIASNELPPLLIAAANKGIVILPVIISPSIMGSLSDFQAVNPPSKPLVDMGRGDRDRVWIKVAVSITSALNQ